MVDGIESSEISEQKEAFFNRLDKKDRENIKRLIDLVKIQEERSGFEVRFVAVGGMVDPKRANQPHKDIDICCYCPELVITNSPEGNRGFDAFTNFFKKALRETGWTHEEKKPYFESWERADDGKITFHPPSGKSIEILPLRKDSGDVMSFDEFLNRATKRGAVLLK